MEYKKKLRQGCSVRSIYLADLVAAVASRVLDYTAFCSDATGLFLCPLHMQQEEHVETLRHSICLTDGKLSRTALVQIFLKSTALWNRLYLQDEED